METINREKETQVFEDLIPMTTSERNLVKKWVSEGHSPFTNPFGLVNLDGGSMLNFIQAMKEYPYIDADGGCGAKRFGAPDAIRLKELAVPGWEEACEGLLRARI